MTTQTQKPAALRVEVGTTYLGQLLGRQGGRRQEQLSRLFTALTGDPDREWSIDVPWPDTRGRSVFDVLRAFHTALVAAIRAHAPDLLEELRLEMEQIGREHYLYPTFTVEERNALRWLGPHRLHVHGLRPLGNGRRQSSFIPDLSLGVRLRAFFPSSGPVNAIDYLEANRHGYDDPALSEGQDGDVGLAALEVNLCDSLAAAHRRACAFADRIVATRPPDENFPPDIMLELTARDALLIDGVVHGFRGYRSLRRSDPRVPTVASHRVLNAAALRHGHAWPLLSGITPRSLWKHLPVPAQDTLLEASEAVASSWIPPLAPNIPLEAEMRELQTMAGLAEGDIGVDWKIDELQHPLRQLGILDVVRSRHSSDEYIGRLERGEWAWDWTWAIEELTTALYDPRVDRSVRLAPILRLQPLHKRLLGLVEQEVIRPLRSRVADGTWTPRGGRTFQASNLLREAFHDPGIAHRVCGGWNDFRATLSVEGTWLLHAAAHGADGLCDLGPLLDEVLAAFLAATPALAGSRVTLAPEDPQAHAEQLRAIAESTDAAMVLTLALGRIALEIRNYIEHAVEEPEDEGVRILNEEHWATTRQYETPGSRGARRSVSLFEWIGLTANDLNWPHATKLPADVPPAATVLLLKADSLFRCLVLTSLFLCGARAHLKLP